MNVTKTLILLVCLTYTTTTWSQNNSIFKGGAGDGFGADVSLTLPLPIELAFFEAVYEPATGVHLRWRTLTELNNDYFILEKSPEGKQFAFSRLTTITGHGTSTILHDYTYTDTDIAPGTYYYRLTQVDINGVTTHHKIITVIIDKTTRPAFVLYPNPSSGEDITIEFAGVGLPHESEVSVVDQSGRRLWQGFISRDDTTGRNFIPTANLVSGLYLVRFSVLTAPLKLIIIK